MSSFYLSDPLVLTELEIEPIDFRIYEYCCNNFSVKKLTSFIRLVNIAGQFQMPLEKVQESLLRLSRIRIDGLPLIKISDNGKYLEFDMPRYRHFVKSLGFEKYNSSRGWKLLREHTAQEVKTNYLFPKLDQWQLFDKLKDLPTDELLKIKETDLKFRWILRDVKKYRQIT